MKRRGQISSLSPTVGPNTAVNFNVIRRIIYERARA